MKKKIELFVLVMLFSIASYAGSGKIVVVNGDKTILNENAKAHLNIDYSNALWEGEPYQMFCGDDYNERIERSYRTFMSVFNNESRGLQLTNKSDTKYSMTVKVKKFLRKVRSFYRGEVMIWCTLQITDNTTGNNLLTVEVTRSGGESDYSYSDGIYKCFMALAERLHKKLK